MKLFNGLLAVAVAALTIASASAVSAGVVYYNGLWYGNICQTSFGWQVVPTQLVGSSCYSPAWNAYGYIANY